MDSRARIRDTSAQDQVVSRPGGLRRVPKAWLVGGAAGLAVLALAVWVVAGWSGDGQFMNR